MKQFIICIMLVIFTNTAFCQQVDQSQPLSREGYLKKSKQQKTTAWVLLGTGVAMFALAAPGNVSFELLGTIAVIGTLTTLGSIPLFISSAKNKRKANAITTFFKREALPVIMQQSIVQKSFPAVSIKVNL